MATALHFQGRLSKAIEVADWAVAHRPEAADPDGGWISPYTYIVGLRGALHAQRGNFELATVDLERALAQASESGDSESLACVYGFAAQHASCTGDSLGAVDHAREMLKAAQRTGIPLLLVDSYLSLGSALGLSERWDDSVEALEQALEIANARGVLLGPKRRILAALAESYLGRNEPERARHIAAELLAAREPGTLLVEIRARLVLARALLRLEGRKARDRVVSTIHRAKEEIELSGARVLVPEIYCVLAELAEYADDPVTCLSELREAHRLYEGMGARGHAERIGALIAPPREIEVDEPARVRE